LVLIMLLTGQFLSAQSPEELVNVFFKGMYEADSNMVKSIFIKSPSFHSLSSTKTNKMSIADGTLKDFLKVVGQHSRGDLDERISNIVAHMEKDLATVTMDFSFFYKQQFSHCGINSFHFLKTDEGWKCTGIDDTHYNKSCDAAIVENAGKFLDEWHMDATRADSTSYFTKLDAKSIFIGTDSSEVWNKVQFGKFAGPYFAKGKAWDFKKISRNVHYEADKNIVWFDEMLATWMGPCRGSGFLNVTKDGNFSIMQYVLSVTVPNDKIQGVIKAIKE
jgi:SnoaL-like domain